MSNAFPKKDVGADALNMDDVTMVAFHVFHMLEAAHVTIEDMDFEVGGSRSFRLDHIDAMIRAAQRAIAPIALEDVDRRRDI